MLDVASVAHFMALVQLVLGLRNVSPSAHTADANTSERERGELGAQVMRGEGGREEGGGGWVGRETTAGLKREKPRRRQWGVRSQGGGDRVAKREREQRRGEKRRRPIRHGSNLTTSASSPTQPLCSPLAPSSFDGPTALLHPHLLPRSLSQPLYPPSTGTPLDATSSAAWPIPPPLATPLVPSCLLHPYPPSVPRSLLRLHATSHSSLTAFTTYLLHSFAVATC